MGVSGKNKTSGTDFKTGWKCIFIMIFADTISWFSILGEMQLCNILCDI